MSTPLDYSKWDNMDDIKAALEDGDDDIGQIGSVVPADGAELPAKQVGEEMISRVTLTGSESAGFVLDTMQNRPTRGSSGHGLSRVVTDRSETRWPCCLA